MARNLILPDDRSQQSDRDHAEDGYSLFALEQLLQDCQMQPDWRSRADRAHAFYDMGKQLTAEQEHRIRVDWGIEPRQTNLIHGVVNGVLGTEAKNRSDVRVEPDDDDTADIAEVGSKQMKEAQREANIDMAVSNGYAGQVKGGIGWVEVSRASDPLEYPIRVQEVHRNEIWYDWRAKHLGLKDARWLIRKRWEDLDEAIALMPQFKQILSSSLNGWDLLNLPDDQSNMLTRAFTNERRTTINRDEWADSTRKRIKLFEVWYRVPAEVVVIHLSPTRRVQYDENNPLHKQAVIRGLFKLSRTTTRQVRMALFAGPHRLLDVATTKRNFPYVPFFAFRDDEDRSPYGLIEGMISPQQEYNERRQMINWMLKARQVYLEADALHKDYNNINDARRTAMRPDAMFVLDPNRRNANQPGIVIKNDLTLQKEQVDVMQDSKQLIQDVPRVYSTQLGDAPSGVTSGIAINSLTEQGVVAMGELNDNYRFARKDVYERVLELIIEDHLEENMKVTIGSGEHKRVVVLNTWDPKTGQPINRVKDAPIKVGLSDVPNSPAYRMQEQQQVATMIQALGQNPQALAILAPAYIEGSSLENRKALADDLRRATGQPVAADRQAMQQAQQQQQAKLAEQEQLQKAAAQLELKDKAAATEKTIAETDKTRAQVEQTQADTELKRMQAAEAAHRMAQPNEDDLVNEALAEAHQ